MEFLRSCYRSKWRLPELPTQETKGRYFFNEDAEAYPGFHCFGSRNWTQDVITIEPEYGERIDAKRSYFNGNWPVAFPDAASTGTAECIENGETSGSGDAIVVSPTNLVLGVLPSCWAAGAPGALVATGGEKESGQAGFSKGWTASGGQKQSGLAVFGKVQSWAAAGGGKQDGAAAIGQGWAWAAAGGGKQDGAAEIGRGQTWEAAGGQKQAGNAGFLREGILYTQSTNSDTTCDVVGPTNRDLLLGSPGTGSITAVTASTTYVQRIIADVAFTAKDGTWKASLAIVLSFSNSSARFRWQILNSSCTVLASSSYSADITTSGTYTLSESTIWPAGGARVRISVELKRVGGVPTPVDVQVTNGSSSYLKLAF